MKRLDISVIEIIHCFVRWYLAACKECWLQHVVGNISQCINILATRNIKQCDAAAASDSEMGCYFEELEQRGFLVIFTGTIMC